jgi:hypothetical protein
MPMTIGTPSLASVTSTSASRSSRSPTLFRWTWAQDGESQRTDLYRHRARSLFDYFLSGEGGSLHPAFATLMAASTKGKMSRRP